MHVGAGCLAVGACVPDLIGWTGSVGIAVFLCAFPCSSVARTCVAGFFTCGSTLVVNTTEQTFAASYWHAFVQFFIDCLSGWALAASNAFFNAWLWLNFAAGQSAAASAFFVFLASWARDGAFGLGSPVVDNNSGEGAFTSIGGKGGALACSISATGADFVHASCDVFGWVDNCVARLECTFSQDSADILCILFVLSVCRAGCE